MTMPPADLCAGEADARIVAAGTTLAPPADATFGCLGVHGTLDLTSVRTLRVRTIHLYPDGTIRAAGDGVARVLEIADVAPTDHGQFGTGLVLEGRIELSGAAKTSWTRLTAELLPGQRTITVADASGWNVGDEIVIADTRFVRPTDQAPETFIVGAVSGTQVVLDRPAAIRHPASRHASGALERFPPVGNLTRSLQIRSANRNGVRGHFMVTTKASGWIRNVEIRDMGRTTNQLLSATNIKGRYALHLHFLDNPGFEVSGNAVTDTTRWGITVHHSNEQIVRNNVVHDVWGAGVMTEDGTETDNQFDRNLVIGVRGDGGGADERASRGEFGTNGIGFWFQGPLNRVTNNVAANSQREGFLLWSDHVTAGKAVRLFSHNEGIANDIGFEVWNVGSPDADSLIDHFYEWHSWSKGFYMYPSRRMVFVDWYGRGDPNAMDPNTWVTGGSFGDYSTIGGSMVRPDIQHKVYGLFVPYGNASSSDPQPRVFRVEGGSFIHNVYGITTRTPGGSYNPEDQKPFQTIIRGVNFSQNLQDIRRWFTVGPGSNTLSVDRFDVIDHQGVSGDNFTVFYKEQAPSFVLPSGNWVGGKPPYAGLKNEQVWNQYGRAIAGAVATCATTTQQIVGFKCPLTSAPPPPPASPPAPPRNVRITQN